MHTATVIAGGSTMTVPGALFVGRRPWEDDDDDLDDGFEFEEDDEDFEDDDDDEDFEDDDLEDLVDDAEDDLAL